MSEHIVDARNLMCPLPVIRAQDKVKTLQIGDQLKVLCTDPGALNDIPAWCRINGHIVVDTIQTEDEIAVILEIAAS